MVDFSGADHAAQPSRLDDKDALDCVEKNLQHAYKSPTAELTNYEFVNWPKQQWARAPTAFRNAET